jgi:hypothetical protein
VDEGKEKRGRSSIHRAQRLVSDNVKRTRGEEVRDGKVRAKPANIRYQDTHLLRGER